MHWFSATREKEGSESLGQFNVLAVLHSAAEHSVRSSERDVFLALHWNSCQIDSTSQRMLECSGGMLSTFFFFFFIFSQSSEPLCRHSTCVHFFAALFSLLPNAGVPSAVVLSRWICFRLCRERAGDVSFGLLQKSVKCALRAPLVWQSSTDVDRIEFWVTGLRA